MSKLTEFLEARHKVSELQDDMYLTTKSMHVRVQVPSTEYEGSGHHVYLSWRGCNEETLFPVADLIEIGTWLKGISGEPDEHSS